MELADWIAMMHPGLAEPLAAWLDDTAGDLEAEQRTELETSSEFYAVTVARAILGEVADA